MSETVPRRPWLVPVLLLLINLVLRLLFLDWHYATYTDSVDYMTALDTIRGTIILPAYPFAIDLLERLTADPQLAGRLVSILAGVLCVLPLFGLTELVFGRRAAVIAAGLYTVSPLLLRWSLRVFPHSLYTLFVLLFLYGLFRCLGNKSPWALALGVFSGSLAVVTYPTGLVLVPVAAAAVLLYFLSVSAAERPRVPVLLVFLAGWGALAAARFLWPFWGQALSTVKLFLLGIFPVNLPIPDPAWEILLAASGWGALLLVLSYLLPAPGRSKGWWWRRPLALIALGASFSGYWFLHYWQHSLSMSTWYQQGMRASYQSLAGRWESWLTHYLLSLPYVLVYPVAFFALLGLVFTLIDSRSRLRRGWFCFYLYFLAAVFYTLVVNKWWTPRYQFDLVAVTLPLAGHGFSLLFSRCRLRFLAWGLLIISLLASALFSALVLRGSRDSFADIRRSADYIRQNLKGRRVYANELRKVSWWAKTPLIGYTNTSRSGVRPGDLVLLVGWHTNLETELRYLQRSHALREVHRETVTVRGLLADDIVDWAGRRLPRRANDPVCWDQRFNVQTFESLIVEVLDSEGAAGFQEGVVLPAAGSGLLTAETVHATYFDSGVWEVLAPPEKGARVVVEMAHARSGPEGSFRMTAYADEDANGLPDRLIASSPPLASAREGEWSRWEFTAPGGKLFVGSAWDLGIWVYYERDQWPDGRLGEAMYYSRGGIPTSRAHPIITNLKISFPSAPDSGAGLKAPSPGSHVDM